MNTDTQAASTTATHYCNHCRRKTQHRENRADRVCTVCAWRTAKGWRPL